MNETVMDQSIQKENLADLESIAAAIFSRHGIDFALAQRLGGWTNLVWMARDLVLRLSTQKEDRSLLREAALAAHLPPGVGYPQLVGTGITEGFAWTLAKKLPGVSLGDAWDGLNWSERASALQGLWERAQAVHCVPCESVADIVPGRAWFNSNNPEEAGASLVHLAGEGIFTQSETAMLQAALVRFWEALPAAPHVLCHGDLTMDNAVWHAGKVIGLLDFEFAVRAPIQLDLNHLVKCAFGPDELSGDQQGLRLDVQDLALPFLRQPGSRALLMGYAVLLELWLLETWLAHPEGEGPLEQWSPLRRLRSLADGKGGYLAWIT